MHRPSPIGIAIAAILAPINGQPALRLEWAALASAEEALVDEVEYSTAVSWYDVDPGSGHTRLRGMALAQVARSLAPWGWVTMRLDPLVLFDKEDNAEEISLDYYHDGQSTTVVRRSALSGRPYPQGTFREGRDDLISYILDASGYLLTVYGCTEATGNRLSWFIRDPETTISAVAPGVVLQRENAESRAEFVLGRRGGRIAVGRILLRGRTAATAAQEWETLAFQAQNDSPHWPRSVRHTIFGKDGRARTRIEATIEGVRCSRSSRDDGRRLRVPLEEGMDFLDVNTRQVFYVGPTGEQLGERMRQHMAAIRSGTYSHTQPVTNLTFEYGDHIGSGGGNPPSSMLTRSFPELRAKNSGLEATMFALWFHNVAMSADTLAKEQGLDSLWTGNISLVTIDAALRRHGMQTATGRFRDVKALLTSETLETVWIMHSRTGFQACIMRPGVGVQVFEDRSTKFLPNNSESFEVWSRELSGYGLRVIGRDLRASEASPRGAGVRPTITPRLTNFGGRASAAEFLETAVSVMLPAGWAIDNVALPPGVTVVSTAARWTKHGEADTDALVVGYGLRWTPQVPDDFHGQTLCHVEFVCANGPSRSTIQHVLRVLLP